MQRLQPLIYELSSPGRTACSLPELDVPGTAATLLPGDCLRSQAPSLPEVSEVDVVRHFTGLSQLNHGVDTGFYPLGSCTMKYNPKISEDLSRLGGFANLHPLAPEEASQGALQLMHEMQQYLAQITGMDAVTLQPAAGAHGELTGLMLIRAYHEQRGERRTKVIVPDSAHGTNPASASINGFTIVQVKSNERGGVDIDALKAVLDNEVACLMLTNPNTLGLFDENIDVIADLVHDAGGLLYYDGANANAIMGYARPGDAGFDVIHLNLHKTFATPHGGGGPGSGPVGCKAPLTQFLPVPVVVKRDDGYHLDYDRPRSIGRVKSFYANFGVVVKAYAYIRELGPDGLRHASEDAVLNANYLAARLKEKYHLVYDRLCKHEFVLSADWQKKATGVRTLDIAKRLLDFGFHPPTVYFPLIVDECLMIEPTETESRETLDSFVEALLQIATEAAEQPDQVKSAPHDTVVGRLDESRAARQPVLRWRPTGA